MKVGRSRCQLALAALYFLKAVPALGQATALGTLLDATSEGPIGGGSVELVEVGSGLSRRSTTDARGTFHLTDLRPGTYSLTASAIGYAPRRVDGVVISESAPPISIRLERLSLLQEQVVTPDRSAGSSFAAPTAISVINGESIRRTTPVGGPVERLQGITGVDVGQRGIAQRTFSARGPTGINSGSLLVLRDFRPVSLPFTRFNIPALIPGSDEDLERIEVVRGPGSALYGPDADRGLVHLITSSPLDRQGTTLSVAAGGRSLGHGSLHHARFIGRRLGVRVSGEYLTVRDWTEADPTDAVPRDEGLQRGAGEARVDWQGGERTRVSLAAGISDAIRMVDQSDPGAIQLRHWRAAYLQARMEDGRLFANLYLNATAGGESYQLASATPVVDDSRALGAQVQHGSSLGPRVDLRYGADLQRIVPRTEGTLDGANEGVDNITQLGAYLSATARLTSRFDLLAAVRGDHHDRLNDLAASPRIGAVFRPSRAQALRLTYNRATSTPIAADLFVDLPLGQRIPGLPYELRVEGTVNRQEFDRSCGGLGGLCMHSPFLPAGPLPTDATLLWPVLVATVPGLADVPAPTAGAIPTRLAVLDLDRQSFVPVLPSEVRDIAPARRSFADVIEVGYRVEITHRVTLVLEVAQSHLSRIGSSLTVQTPNVFLDSAGVAAYLMANGTSPAQAEALADAVAGIPLGVITPVGTPDPAAILLLPRQGGTADFWNLDAEIAALVTGWLRVTGSYSWVSRDLFPRSAGLADVALNAPRRKGAVTASLLHTRSGLTLDVRQRWVGSFPVRAGIYVGTVTRYAVTDVMLAVPVPRRQGVVVSLAATNVFDYRHREFAGAPEIGRLVVARTRVTF